MTNNVEQLEAELEEMEGELASVSDDLDLVEWRIDRLIKAVEAKQRRDEHEKR